MLLEAFTLLFVGIFIGISQSAGIGGGAIINVLLIFGLGHNAKSSIPVTYIFLMGGGLASAVSTLKKSSETGERLLDYNLVMMTLPMMMSGAIYGTIINHFISELIITILFVILILYLIYSTYVKLKESKMRSQPSLLKHGNNMTMEDIKPMDSSQQPSRLEEILQQQNSLLPIDKFKIILQIYAYTLVLLLCRGGKNYDSFIGLQSCGIGSWICAILHLILSYLYSKSIAIKKFQIDLQKESLGYIFQDHSQKMTEQKMRQGMFNGFLAGVLGGSVSIGGGMVLVPLWIKSGMDKNVAASSTGPLIFFSSTVSFFISVLLGSYHSLLQVLFYFALSFVSSYLIKNFIAYLTQKYQFKQMIFMLLLFLMALSLFTLLPFQYFKFQQDPYDFMAFDVFC